MNATAASPTSASPIIVMSFNRPPYLEQVLESVVQQRSCGIERRAIFLLQDGAINPFSKRVASPPELIEQSIAAFQRIVPWGTVKASAGNLSVALNFDRAERFCFEELGAEAAIFLEDDMTLSPDYIATMDAMIACHADDARVGYLGAYGEYTMPLSEQMRPPGPGGLLAMHHNWAFAVYARQWRLMRPHVEQYLALVSNVDYRRRNEDTIKALHAEWGFRPQASSQDAAKTMACCLTKTIKIKTRGCLGRYIGAKGVHMSPKVFETRGYDRAEMYPEAITQFEPVTDILYHRVLAELLRWAGTAPKVGQPA